MRRESKTCTVETFLLLFLADLRSHKNRLLAYTDRSVSWVGSIVWLLLQSFAFRSIVLPSREFLFPDATMKICSNLWCAVTLLGRHCRLFFASAAPSDFFADHGKSTKATACIARFNHLGPIVLLSSIDFWVCAPLFSLGAVALI